ncbi:NAD+ synthase [Acuticoccus mangrovi]|uniref:Glutamine-dependent NAD(+) synthetase n=1 Tax=Acuticoccus mangrovi TaxID=2796142 RepID=A0A934IFL5_9HYPH|nr:NAD+ synthase [Acuticoccus mangrovi]MBJ3774106.1 NAD+ synthase [Acuticoccus mangrovi]
MRDRFTIRLEQLNPTMGDLAGNREMAEAAVRAAGDVDLVLFTELFITGYPPEDLVTKRSFTERAMAEVKRLAAAFPDGPAIAIGTPWLEDGVLTNAVAVLKGGKVVATRHKVDLPNYDEFDEKRVFTPGPMPGPVDIDGVRVGLPVCEDIWTPDVVECLAETGAEMLLVPNGSPYTRTKQDTRMQVAVARVVESGLPLVYLNQIGGQDELIFDGASFVLAADRSLTAQLPAFKPASATVSFVREGDGWVPEPGPMAQLPELHEAEWTAAMLGLRDYVNKNRFPSVVIGLSGGIDSAICAALAVDALGAERVHCIMMPYRYTSNESLSDAADVAERLGVRYDIVPIAPAVEGFSEQLAPVFNGRAPDVTEENIQSRVRGTTLMAVSNKFGGMVVTTGNKSEVSVGYATLYGDMNGGYNPIKDLYKTEVFALCRWRNGAKPEGALGPDGVVIPERIIDKPPTAELRENQKDEDSLPPYATLDGILRRLIEDQASVSDIVAEGFDEATVRRVEHLLHIAEYKRRQAAPGVKFSPKAFGRDRRYPIVNRFRDV